MGNKFFDSGGVAAYKSVKMYSGYSLAGDGGTILDKLTGPIGAGA